MCSSQNKTPNPAKPEPNENLTEGGEGRKRKSFWIADRLCRATFLVQFLSIQTYRAERGNGRRIHFCLYDTKKVERRYKGMKFYRNGFLQRAGFVLLDHLSDAVHLSRKAPSTLHIMFPESNDYPAISFQLTADGAVSPGVAGNLLFPI